MRFFAGEVYLLKEGGIYYVMGIEIFAGGVVGLCLLVWVVGSGEVRIASGSESREECL